MNKKAVKDIVSSGGHIEYRDLYIGPMDPKYTEGRNRGGWQVHAENRKLEHIRRKRRKEKSYVFENIYSEIFFDLDDAIEKFYGLKVFLYDELQKSETNDSGLSSE